MKWRIPNCRHRHERHRNKEPFFALLARTVSNRRFPAQSRIRRSFAGLISLLGRIWQLAGGFVILGKGAHAVLPVIVKRHQALRPTGAVVTES